MAADDFYAALGVRRDATQPEITRAYRRLVRELHPDAHPPDEGSGGRLGDVIDAYAVLGDPVRRAAYDRASARRERGAHPGPAAARLSDGPVLADPPRDRAAPVDDALTLAARWLLAPERLLRDQALREQSLRDEYDRQQRSIGQPPARPVPPVRAGPVRVERRRPRAR